MKRYFKINYQSNRFYKLLKNVLSYDTFLSNKKMFNNVYFVSEGKIDNDFLISHLIEIEEQEYVDILNLWNSYSRVGDLRIEEVWCIQHEKGYIVSSRFKTLKQAIIENKKFSSPYHHVASGFVIKNSKNQFLKQSKIHSGFYTTHEKALMIAYKEVYGETDINGNEYYLSKNKTNDFVKDYIFVHIPNQLKNDREIEVQCEVISNQVITTEKENLTKIKKYEYFALKNLYEECYPNSYKLLKAVSSN